MIISMQGNWKVTVKSKSASYDQRFLVSGAVSGNGSYAGTVGVSATVVGNQWSIAIQNNPGTGFRVSKAQIKFPHRVGTEYVFDIGSEDGADGDFNDLVLTCSTVATINDFMIYGNVSLYSGRCLFNPCRKRPYVIDTYPGLLDAMLNPKLKDLITNLYPERVPHFPFPPEPDPGPFKPIVLDLFGEATLPKTQLVYQRKEAVDSKSAPKARAELSAISGGKPFNEFNLLKSAAVKSTSAFSTSETMSISENIFTNRPDIAKAIDGLYFGCQTEPAENITLTFEEYDRTGAELAGGAYSGTGNRQLLGDTVTDMFGNYIFRFAFDLEVPGLADAGDIAFGENVDVIIYPDIIVKVTGFAPYTVLYESAPYYNIPNLKRINLCLPKSTVRPTAACFNGNLVGSLGNVFIGGNQNTFGSESAVALTRSGYSNDLDSTGRISVNNTMAQFKIQCAAWEGVIDMRGCMYDTSKPADQNLAKWYTIRIKRAGTSNWTFVSQNYKHPKFSNRNLPNYIGDDVGPFTVPLHVDGGDLVNVAAYKNIQHEINAEGIDWEFANSDRYMQLYTTLFDMVAGVVTPGTFLVKIDCYDVAGKRVPNLSDMIPLYIHNVPLNFGLVGPVFANPAIVNAGCGLYRLTDGQMNDPLNLSFMANDPYGFVDLFELTMGRCPEPMLALQINTHKPPLANTTSLSTTMSSGSAPLNTFANNCPGYTGTLAAFSSPGMIKVEFQPGASETGWIRAAEYYTVLSFTLSAYKRVTNGYNDGRSGQYLTSSSVAMERLSP